MEWICVFTFGMVAYPILEVIWRGYTHITMAFAGGLCLTAIYYIAVRLRHMNLFAAAAVGCAAVTAIELIFGFIFNIAAGMAVWDYSGRPYNFMGQICLEYTALWYLLCVVIMPVCRFIHLAVIKVR